MRSNISPKTPRELYFPLPPARHTKQGRRAGIHYQKMFPIAQPYYQQFKVEGNRYYEVVSRYVNKHEREIVTGAQRYLTAHESQGGRGTASTSIA